VTWGRRIEPGDWVRTTEKVSVGIADELLGTGVPAGARGVVCERNGSWLRVDLEHGLATVSVRVRARDCRVVRRQGGRERFHRWSGRRRAARIGLLCFTLWPLAQFTVLYWWYNRSFEGLTGELALAAVDSAVEMADHLVTDPARTLVYLGFLAVVGRLALSD
jgi:hypothetical protein